jgi:hypothetical protein
MYKIIGADKKEYGPISADQMRQWISEGRVSAQTLAQAEGQMDWRPVIAFPEFADVLGAAPGAAAPAAPVADGGREAALSAVKGPAIGLLVTAILGLIAVALGLIVNVLTLVGVPIGMHGMSDPQMQKYFNMAGGGFGIIQNIIGAVIGVLIWRGAAKMKALENHQFAFTASILAMLPCISPCCLLGLPFGIWALVVISKPEIKSQFS